MHPASIRARKSPPGDLGVLLLNGKTPPLKTQTCKPGYLQLIAIGINQLFESSNTNENTDYYLYCTLNIRLISHLYRSISASLYLYVFLSHLKKQNRK